MANVNCDCNPELKRATSYEYIEEGETDFERSYQAKRAMDALFDF